MLILHYTIEEYHNNTMESCFPPLASLALRGNSTNSPSASSASSSPATVAGSNKHQKNRHSLGGGGGGGVGAGMASNGDAARERSSDYLPKLDVIQDLDLYYIRQIACSLKVSIRIPTTYN